MSRYIKYSVFAILSGIFAFSCGEMDETYHEFIKDGEIVYSGKPSYFTAMSGNRRMVLYFQLLADPKIEKARIFWNNPQLPSGVTPEPGQRLPGRDSIEIDLGINGTGYTRASVPYTINTYYYLVPIPNLVEGVFSFQIYTYDKLGNVSIKAESIGEVFGPTFQNSITNRPLERAVMYNQFNNPNKELDLEWLGAAKAIVAVDIKYTDINDVTLVHRDTKVYVDPGRPPVFLSRTIVPEYKAGTTVEYRTGFVPTSFAADTFWTEYAPIASVQTNRIIRPGIYKIKPRHAPTQFLKTRANATTANAVIEQNIYEALLSSQWKVLYTTDGFNIIKNSNSSMDLALSGTPPDLVAGNIIQIVQTTDTHDEWTIDPVDASNVYFRLKNRKSGKVAGLTGAATTAGTALQQQTVNLTANSQQFELEFVQSID